jgi:hypothetical protein
MKWRANASYLIGAPCICVCSLTGSLAVLSAFPPPVASFVVPSRQHQQACPPGWYCVMETCTQPRRSRDGVARRQIVAPVALAANERGRPAAHSPRIRGQKWPAMRPARKSIPSLAAHPSAAACVGTSAAYCLPAAMCLTPLPRAFGSSRKRKRYMATVPPLRCKGRLVPRAH